MSDFQKSIKTRINELSKSTEMSNVKSRFNRIYSKALIENDGKDVSKVNDFQAAFLDLLNQKHLHLVYEFKKALDKCFYDMYKNSDDEEERKYTPKEELTLHRIQVPSKCSDDWQLMYEMQSDDTVFHIEFEGWSFKSIGITH